MYHIIRSYITVGQLTIGLIVTAKTARQFFDITPQLGTHMSAKI